MKLFNPVFLVFFLLLHATQTFAISPNPCAQSELVITNKTFSQMHVVQVNAKGNSRLHGIHQGTNLKLLGRLHIQVYADTGFSLYRNTAEGDIQLISTHLAQQIATFNYRFYPHNSVCEAEGAVTFKGQPNVQVLLRTTASTHEHPAHLEFVLLRRAKTSKH